MTVTGYLTYQANTNSSSYSLPRPETPPTPLSGLYSLGMALCYDTVISLVEKMIIQCLKNSNGAIPNRRHRCRSCCLLSVIIWCDFKRKTFIRLFPRCMVCHNLNDNSVYQMYVFVSELVETFLDGFFWTFLDFWVSVVSQLKIF